jgi:Permease for cytosine/purines, uracil, thiamine, allantoin
MSQTEPAALERRTIDIIPLDERHGKPRDLFTIWFSSNIMPLTFVTGALAPAVFGLSFWWSLIAIVLGNVVGALFMALHSAQGPRLGVPQMIQSRAQFGYLGALVVVLVAVAMYVGFFASNLVLGGQSINQLASGVSVDWGIVICALVSLVITIFGYDMIPVPGAGDRPAVELPHQLHQLHPAAAVRPDPVDRDQPGGLLPDPPRRVRRRSVLRPERRPVRAHRLDRGQRLPHRHPGRGPVHVDHLVDRPGRQCDERDRSVVDRGPSHNRAAVLPAGHPPGHPAAGRITAARSPLTRPGSGPRQGERCSA